MNMIWPSDETIICEVENPTIENGVVVTAKDTQRKKTVGTNNKEKSER